jgi:cytochrome c-type biogenesis protein CcmF
VSILVACFWGVIFPLISELFTGQKVTVGPPFYERTTGPMFAGLLLLMGIAPLSAWGRTAARSLGRLIAWPLGASRLVPNAQAVGGTRNPWVLLGFWLAALVTFVTLYEFWRGALARRRINKESFLVALWNLAGRNRRRYGGYIIHLGVVLMAIGIIGTEFFQQETQGTLAEGQQMTLGRYVMTYDSLAEFNAPDERVVARAVTTVYRDGQKVAELYPRRDFYYVTQQPMTIPGVYSSLEGDFYVLLVGWEPIASSGATFKVYFNPLINFLWGGSLVFILGTLVAAWPERERKRAAARVPAGALAARWK